MPRYIDADKQKNLIDNCADLGGKLGEIITLIKGYAKSMVDATPTADVVEVIRCKDCKYRHKEWHHDKRNKNGGYWISGCYNDAIAERVYGLAQAYDFCSYGEKA